MGKMSTLLPLAIGAGAMYAMGPAGAGMLGGPSAGAMSAGGMLGPGVADGLALSGATGGGGFFGGLTGPGSLFEGAKPVDFAKAGLSMFEDDPQFSGSAPGLGGGGGGTNMAGAAQDPYAAPPGYNAVQSFNTPGMIGHSGYNGGRV